MTHKSLPIADEVHEHYNPTVDPRWARFDPYLELAIAVLLGLAAIMIAVAVYHNEAADHDATVEFTGAIRAATSASGDLAESSQAHGEERALFVAYAQDLHAGDHTLADYLAAKVMSAELSKAVGWWRTRSANQDSPFVDKDPAYSQLASEQLFEDATGRNATRGRRGDRR